MDTGAKVNECKMMNQFKPRKEGNTPESECAAGGRSVLPGRQGEGELPEELGVRSKS